jgi:hypothetical protein
MPKNNKNTVSKASANPSVANISPPNHDADHVTPPNSNGRQPPPVFNVRGPMSTFGGPHDTGMSPSEGLALFDRPDLQDPRHKKLFLPFQPPGTTGLGRRLNPDEFYLACRWDYSVTSRSFLRNTVAQVQSVRTGQVKQARPADWGPNPRTGRIADLSPGLAAALELDTDDEVIVTITGAAAEFVTREAANAFAGGPEGGTTEPRIYSTSEWGAEPAKVAHFPERPAAGIVVHNTENPNRAPLTGKAEETAAAKIARSIQSGHFARGFSDTGQHFTISRGGLILEGRHGSLAAARAGRVVAGAHAKSSDGSANATWFGIELEGDNRQSDQVTQPQYDSLVELCAWLMKWAGVRTLPIKPHLEVLTGHTDCPGAFKNRMPALRQDAQRRRDQLG